MRGRVAFERRRGQPPGRLVVVGGHTRGVGKTALVEQLLRGWRGGPVAAVKISAHRHAPQDCAAPVIEEVFDRSPTTQTGRYLAGGADRAWLCRCPSDRIPDAARFVQALQRGGWDVVVESNRIVQHLCPDLTLFVASDRTDDWKPSSGACLRRADALVLSAGSRMVPVQARWQGWAPGDPRPVFRFDESWHAEGVEAWAHPRPARAAI